MQTLSGNESDEQEACPWASQDRSRLMMSLDLPIRVLTLDVTN